MMNTKNDTKNDTKLEKQKIYSKWFTFKVVTSTILLIELHTTKNSPYICHCMRFISVSSLFLFPWKVGVEFEEWSILGAVTLLQLSSDEFQALWRVVSSRSSQTADLVKIWPNLYCRSCANVAKQLPRRFPKKI